ncbi:MAG: hypothetical protein IK099_05490 [Clostridia bacterium]|nr:hypothetical protein [Clostridia bacterium]
MKKFLMVLLWIGLAVCLVMLVSGAGEKYGLRDDLRKEKQKYDALKTVYDREKEEWQVESSELAANNAALTLEKQTLAAALRTVRQEMDAVKAERETIAAEKDEASGRLSEILAVLLPGESDPSPQQDGQEEKSGDPLPSTLSRPELLPM